MTWQYRYTPYIWLMLVSAVSVATLAVFGWRRRRTPGARPFVILMGLLSAWSLFSALNVAAVDEADKFFWVKAEALCGIIMALPSLCFALEFAGLNRWMTRRNLILLACVPALAVFLVITNESHHLFYARTWFDGYIRFTAGPLYTFVIAYSYALPLLNTVIFLWLFVRSSGIYRWQAGLVLFGGLVPRMGLLLEFWNLNPLAPLDMTILTADVMAVCYAVALFHFRMFDVVPIARNMLLGLMREGVLVLDAQDRVVELNKAAGRLLSLHQRACLGKPVADVLADFPSLAAVLGQSDSVHAELVIDGEAPPRWFEVFISRLVHERGWPLGRLVLLYDITERMQARQQRIEQQAAVAALAEREQVARELHDGLGQVLGYVKMQAQAARSLLAQGRQPEADSYLERLVAVASDAHADVRDYIFEASAASPIEQGFSASLQQYLQRFSQTHQIQTKLEISPETPDGVFEPAVAVQLLRIIQEALTNARKHAHATHVRVSLAARDGTTEVTIADDGQGFDPGQVEGDGFGLRFMRERAQAVGGSLQVHSAAGRGTSVLVQVPLRKDGNS